MIYAAPCEGAAQSYLAIACRCLIFLTDENGLKALAVFMVRFMRLWLPIEVMPSRLQSPVGWSVRWSKERQLCNKMPTFLSKLSNRFVATMFELSNGVQTSKHIPLKL